MTREETQNILAVIDVTFPNFKPDNLTATVDAWHFFLADYPYEAIQAALKIYVTTENSGFAPSPSQLIGMINKTKALTMTTEVEVWREVRQAIRNGIYGSETEFDKLSDTAKKMVGDPQQLREWAMLPSEDIDTVVQSNFKSRFKAMQTRQAEINAMPNDIRNLIEKSTKQIGVSE
jgi:hypothetical protein